MLKMIVLKNDKANEKKKALMLYWVLFFIDVLGLLVFFRSLIKVLNCNFGCIVMLHILRIAAAIAAKSLILQRITVTCCLCVLNP